MENKPTMAISTQSVVIIITKGGDFELLGNT